jgi:hypothetical protein
MGKTWGAYPGDSHSKDFLVMSGIKIVRPMNPVLNFMI